MFESRSAAFEKLGDIIGALKDARKVIDMAPASPQVSATGHAFSSRSGLITLNDASAPRVT